VDAPKAVPVPDGVAPEIAAAALLQGMTAHYLARSTYAVGPGDVAVVHAAAGGVGLLLTQIVKLHGATVIGTTSSEEKAELARAAGADHVLGYDGFAEQVRELTGGEGASVVYDGIGHATFAESLKAVRPRGLVALYGAASGPPPPLTLAELERAGSLYVTRPSLRHYTRTREELLERTGDVFAWHAAGKLELRIGGRYPLEQARQAQEDLASRKTTGKLILLP
jgi:NADPH2:quinone reductase